jgi:hypothetical protein
MSRKPIEMIKGLATVLDGPFGLPVSQERIN